MQAILDGMRAGVLVTIVLTLWCFLVASGSTEGTASVAFTAAAFGFLGLPQILYGVGFGALMALWLVVLKRTGMSPVREALREPNVDRRLAAGLMTFPLMVAVIAVGVMGVHLYITSGFARPSFQAQGLALAAGALTVGAVLGAPLIYGIIEGGLKRLPLGKERSMWTWLVIGGYGLVALLIAAVGYSYASGLRVWSEVELQMGIVAVALAPLLTVAMYRWSWQRAIWRFGVPLAGLGIAGSLFIVAPSWVASNAEMRAMVLRDAPLVPTIARHVVDLDGGDEQVFAYEGCDEDDEDCVIEEDVVPLSSPDHPVRRAVSQGVRAGNRAQRNTFESIPSPPKNVVFILVDTLRQDHMGYAGYHRDTTPNIDAIAEDAVVFNDAYATSPHTPRTLPPIFFGRYASNIRWYMPSANFPRVRPENISMYEVLQERGWNNLSKTSHFYFRERRGLNQGFDVWDNEGATNLEDSNTDIASPRIWEKLEPRLTELGAEHREGGEEARPFSIFVHLFDPHSTYNHHEEFGFDRGNTNHERLIADYDSEIAHADTYVGRIVDKLKEEGLYDDVILVITSDHGESFNEHGYYFHGQTLYNTVLNVPKLIRVPGWFSHEVDGQVSVLDIAPTLLDLLDVPIPGDFQGETLTNVLLARSEVPDRPVFGELLPYTSLDRHHRAVVYNDQKLIVDFSLGLEEFYDLSEDREEQNNLIDSRPEDAAKLREMLDEFMN